jgi:hypothetical protein
MSETEKRKWERPWRAARQGRNDSDPARPAGWWTQADIDYARDFVARQRANGMLDAPTPPDRALHARPPSPEGEGEQDSLTRHGRTCCGHPRLEDHPKKDVDGRDRPGHDENKEPAPVERAVERSVERPWIPAAVRAQMPVIDPMFTVKRVKEDGSADPHHGYRWI